MLLRSYDSMNDIAPAFAMSSGKLYSQITLTLNISFSK